MWKGEGESTAFVSKSLCQTWNFGLNFSTLNAKHHYRVRQRTYEIERKKELFAELGAHFYLARQAIIK